MAAIKEPRRQANFRLDAPTMKALEVMAEREKRSQARIIELAVEEYYVNHHEAGLRIEQALVNAKVNNG